MDSFCHLPEITEEALTEEMQQKGIVEDVGPFYKQYRCIFGWVAQTTYVCVPALQVIVVSSKFTRGAQVGVAAFVVNYITEQGLGISQSKASTMFSLCQVTFTIGRYVLFRGLLRKIQSGCPSDSSAS